MYNDFCPKEEIEED
uniref:Uncharacterized protein n=1 Tax=Arundo donax TaxID=35708 RepID=A0A0A9B6X5_ARUDO